MLTDTPISLSWHHGGYMPSYHAGEINHCPGCGRHNWIVGRLMAECAFCEAALPLEHIHGYGSMQRVSRQGEPLTGQAPDLLRVA
jgi:hypothetical protein